MFYKEFGVGRRVKFNQHYLEVISEHISGETIDDLAKEGCFSGRVIGHEYDPMAKSVGEPLFLVTVLFDDGMVYAIAPSSLETVEV